MYTFKESCVKVILFIHPVTFQYSKRFPPWKKNGIRTGSLNNIYEKLTTSLYLLSVGTSGASMLSCLSCLRTICSLRWRLLDFRTVVLYLVCRKCLVFSLMPFCRSVLFNLAVSIEVVVKLLLTCSYYHIESDEIPQESQV